ncbi:biotin--[acetyl-CoA-carboxylase] ligase [Flavobacterium sp.]|uniref:biotin--[acetyl-CoA-carboxylase] ligase n=1 Tax=Flavobacterium sp. TaxID=239 RepID=UPI00262DED1C|nr:biotin--[acetyl-CoA-carboxylase] ligase [Flavobacterium sp.]MDD3005083.1 biotin--[acetyl-CoA-carboxylase] ligase [Flavobacterium sp.]
MKLIKLNAIDSTNDFLKQLASTQELENFTVVSAENQLNGKGQMGSNWFVEPGKNLTFSIYYANSLDYVESIYDLNIAVAISIIEVLKWENIPELKIKWPNDIMSANKKIGGILIENVFKNNHEIQSIIGIGLNVNQRNYDNLPQASSLCLSSGRFFDCDALLQKIVSQIAVNLQFINENKAHLLWDKYHQLLYKMNVPSAFENREGDKFMGIIKKVLPNGKLEVEMEDDSLQHFTIKEIKMLY